MAHQETDSLQEMGETGAKALYQLFLEHPHEQSMGYFSHAVHALSLSFWTAVASLSLVIHAVIPGCFRTRGTSIIKKLAHDIEEAELKLMAKELASMAAEIEVYNEDVRVLYPSPPVTPIPVETEDEDESEDEEEEMKVDESQLDAARALLVLSGSNGYNHVGHFGDESESRKKDD